MKISSVDTFVLRSQLPQPFAHSQGWITQRSTTLVRIRTTDGVEGWGETFSVSVQPHDICASVIDSALAPLIIGEDPHSTDVLWDRMYVRTRDYGRKGLMIAAISAVDMALWDIRGKVAGQPLWQLLGGAFRDRVQCYATGFFRSEGRGQAEELAAEAVKYADAGFDFMKVKLGFGLDDDIEVMEAINDAVGDRAKLMIDVNHAYGTADAIRLGRALDHLRLRWFEEPVVPEDLRGYNRVRSAIDTPIAGGEADFTMYGFRDLIAAEAVDIVQPDICLAGGFTALKHINVLAQSAGVQVNPHVWGTAIGQYASLHVLANTPTTHFSIFADQPLFEYDMSDHPFRTDLVTTPLNHEKGWLDLPQGPGLGLEIDQDFLTRHALPH